MPNTELAVDPDVMLDGVARHHRKADGTSQFHTYRTFFEQAAAGTLPNFVWIAPNATTMDHPCEDVAKGERLLKDIYEAIRSSPQWNRTMLAVLCESANDAMHMRIFAVYYTPSVVYN